jgi:hypothetical protein
MRAGICHFDEIHSGRMTGEQREAFRKNVRFFQGINELEVSDDDSAGFLEPLLPLLRTRLDEKRREMRSNSCG